MEYIALTSDIFIKPTADYLRIATAAPEVAIADVPANVRLIGSTYRDIGATGAELAVLPELCLTGYTAADLLHNQHLLEQTQKGLAELAAITVDGPTLVVGAPLAHNGVLYNCGVVLAAGRIAGVVPKSYVPNYKEFYEQRWFSSGKAVKNQTMAIGDQAVPFGVDLLFKLNNTTLGIELCEDVFAPVNPGSAAALAGAEIIVNLSASNELIGKTNYRRSLIQNFSGRLICGYIYSSAGRGESVADVVYGGHQMIVEDGRLSAERKPHSLDTTPLVYDLDRSYLAHDRFVNKTFAEQAVALQSEQTYRTITITSPRPADARLQRQLNTHPFVPSNPETLNERCEEIFTNVATALAQRIRDAKSDAIVLGLSGGQDSALALVTGMYACDLLGRSYDFIHTITMPGQASSERTQDNASLLAAAVGTTHRVIPIKDLATGLLTAIGHDLVSEDITYENTQARMRTTILMNYANLVHGFVEGTGDLSENAIGWCTFNGDHMSMYNPNGAIPKTLVSHLVGWYAEQRSSSAAQTVLRDILATPISPELTGNGDLSQITEDVVGPYALKDFFTYEHLRYGSRPSKIGYLAVQAFEGTYSADTIATWLNKFFERFTASQWKRDVMPNGTKVGSVSVSPRGDLRMAPNTSPHWFK